MIVDSSALVAILRHEPERRQFAEIIARADRVRISAASYLETAIVIDRDRNPAVSRALDSLLAEAGIEIEPVTRDQVKIAREANRDFGKRSGHLARLNFGDCLTYALAKALGEPLLFKGLDFAQTDLESAAHEG